MPTNTIPSRQQAFRNLVCVAHFSLMVHAVYFPSSSFCLLGLMVCLACSASRSILSAYLHRTSHDQNSVFFDKHYVPSELDCLRLHSAWTFQCTLYCVCYGNDIVDANVSTCRYTNIGIVAPSNLHRKVLAIKARGQTWEQCR